MKLVRQAITVLTSLAAVAALAAQGPADERIRRVENGLLPPVVVKGQPVRTMKLDDRMRELIGDLPRGRGILGVVDGASPKGVEGDEDIAWRKGFLRQIGYKL